MSKPNFHDEYTYLQRQVINKLAEIEQHDRDACANCGGEDCVCCEIYQDRQRWVSPAELFADDDAYRRYCNYEGPDDEYYDTGDDGDGENGPNPNRFQSMCEPDEEEMSEPYGSPSYRDEYPTTHGFGGKKDYPCDVPPFHCPFKTSEDDATSSYFCRDHCGMGVDD